MVQSHGMVSKLLSDADFILQLAAFLFLIELLFSEL